MATSPSERRRLPANAPRNCFSSGWVRLVTAAVRIGESYAAKESAEVLSESLGPSGDRIGVNGDWQRLQESSSLTIRADRAIGADARQGRIPSIATFQTIAKHIDQGLNADA